MFIKLHVSNWDSLTIGFYGIFCRPNCFCFFNFWRGLVPVFLEWPTSISLPWWSALVAIPTSETLQWQCHNQLWSFVKLSGLVKSVTKMLTGCWKNNKSWNICSSIRLRGLFVKYEKYVTLSMNLTKSSTGMPGRDWTTTRSSTQDETVPTWKHSASGTVIWRSSMGGKSDGNSSPEIFKKFMLYYRNL